MRKIPGDRQILEFGSRILLEDGSLSQHGIVNGSMVIVDDMQPIRVKLVRVGGEWEWLAVSPFLYIEELRCAVRRHFGLCRMEYPFIGLTLEDNLLITKDRLESTLTDCGIVDKTVITTVISGEVVLADWSRSRS